MQPFGYDAKWVWARGYDRPNMFLVARCPDGSLVGATGELTLQISVDSDFALLCERAGELQTLAFGQFPDYAARKVYEERIIAADACRDGMLYLLLTSQNCDTSTDRRERAGVIFCLRDETGRVLWCSDESTALYYTRRHIDRDVPLVTGQLGFSFDIDLTQPLCGEVADTEVLTDMPATLYPRPIATLQMGERVSSVCVLQTPFSDSELLPETAFGARMQRARFLDGTVDADGQAYIFDLGAEQVGFCELDITTTQPCEVLIGWGEHLADQRVRTEVGGRCFGARCRLAAGENHLLYPLRRLGLRYLQLHIYAPAASVDIRYAGVRPVDYPLPEATPYPGAEKDGRQAAIYETCLRTLRLCLHDHYEDCPWREQALYTMDSRNQMLCGYYAYGETAAPRASLSLIAQSLREDDLLELCSPARCAITIPAFSAMFVVQLAEYAEHSGDLALVRELLPTAERILEGFISHMADEKDGLIACYPEREYWNFYEWQTGLEGSISGSVAPEDMTYDAPLCCFVSLAMAALASLYLRFDMYAEAQRMLTLNKRLNRAVHQYFYDERAGMYDSYLRLRDGVKYHRAQLTQALALCCGACPEAEAERLRERLAHDDSLYPVTLSHSIFRYDALLADKKYLPLILQEIRDIWGSMLDAGATTFWETAQGQSDFGNAGSLCHGWSAVPLYIYHRYGTGDEGI